jgi:hypothetical protein
MPPMEREREKERKKLKADESSCGKVRLSTPLFFSVPPFSEACCGGVILKMTPHTQREVRKP